MRAHSSVVPSFVFRLATGSLSALAFLSLAVVALDGCAPTVEGSRGNGALLTDDGRIIANTDRHHRDETVRHITTDLDAAVAPGWTSRVVIDELPTWVPGIEPNDGDWRWAKATVHLTLTGSGPLTHPPEELRQGVVDYLAKRVRQPTKNLSVTLTSAASPEQTPMPATQSDPPNSARTYHIQPGDTLADISTIFYGAPEHWRLLITANPGLDPAQMTVGSVLTIPPKP